MGEDKTAKEKASDRIKALEVINKMLGFNSPDKSEVKQTDVTMTAEEREQMIKDLRDKL